MRKSTNMLVSMLGAASLTFALALTGCGQAADTGSAETEEAVEAETTTDEEAAADENAIELEIPEDLGTVTRAAGELVETEADALETTDLAELPESDEDSVVDDKETVEEESGDASKAPSDAKPVTYGGLAFYMPTSWQGQNAGNEFLMMSLDGGVAGCVQATRIPSGASYDLVAMCEAIPKKMASEGYTDIKVTDYGTGRSSSGKLVDAYIQIDFTVQGTRCVGYFEYLQSKSYMNYLGMSGMLNDWNKNVDGAAMIVNTVSFAPGEAI